MLFHRLQCAVAVFIALAPVLALAQPPVPNDPLEVVTAAQPIQNPEQRLAATSLLANARALSNVRARAYDLKTTFTSNGSSSSDGSWSMEDISPSSGFTAGPRRALPTRPSISTAMVCSTATSLPEGSRFDWHRFAPPYSSCIPRLVRAPRYARPPAF